MNTVRRCVLIVLFALLARPALAAPGAATLIAPSGDLVGTTIAFSWQSVPESTWYLFWLGKGTPTAFVMEQWYTAEQAGCAGGGTCTVTLTPPVNAGTHVWFIRTWGAGLDGPWSAGKVFGVKDPATNWSSKLAAAGRFTLVLGGTAALDNETGLVWERQPGPIAFDWPNVQLMCAAANAGGRLGWRVPTLSELQSLIDSTQSNPALPAGHPFLGTLSTRFWTQTASTATAGSYFAGDIAAGTSVVMPAATNYRTWCVRAPSAGGQ